MCLNQGMAYHQIPAATKPGIRPPVGSPGNGDLASGLAPLVVTVREAARLLRCSQEVVYELIYCGKLRALRPSRRFIIPTRAIDEFLEGTYENGS